MADNQIREPIIVRIPSLNYIDRKSSIILTVRQQPTFFHFLTVFLPLSFFFFVCFALFILRVLLMRVTLKLTLGTDKIPIEN